MASSVPVQRFVSSSAVIALILLAQWVVVADAAGAPALATVRIFSEDGRTLLYEDSTGIDVPDMHRFAVMTEGWNVGSATGRVAIDDLTLVRSDGTSDTLTFNTAPTVIESTTGATHAALGHEAAEERLIGLANSGYACRGNYQSFDTGGSPAWYARFTMTRLPTGRSGNYWEMYVGLMPGDSEPEVGSSCTSRTPSGRFENMVGLHISGDGQDRDNVARRSFGLHADGVNGPMIPHTFNTRYVVEIIIGTAGETPPTTAPTGIRAITGPGNVDVRIEWDAVAGVDRLVGYNVYREGTFVGRVPMGVHVFEDATALPGTRYEYDVRAVNGAGPGPASSTVAITTGGNPGAGSRATLRITDVATGTVILDEEREMPFNEHYRFAVATAGWTSGNGFGKVAIDDLEITRSDGAKHAFDFATAPVLIPGTESGPFTAVTYDAANERLMGEAWSGNSCTGSYASLELGVPTAIHAAFTVTRLPTGSTGSYWDMYLGLLPGDHEVFVAKSCEKSTPSGRPDNLIGLHVAGDGQNRDAVARRGFSFHTDGTEGPTVLHSFNTEYRVEIGILGYVDPPTGAPMDVEAVPGPGAGTVTVAWSPPDDPGPFPPTGYDVARDGVIVARTDADGRSLVDAGLPDGATVAYRVFAVNAGGAGPASEEVRVNVPRRPGAPLDFAAVAGPGAGELSLEWTAADPGDGDFLGYRIHGGDVPDDMTVLADIGNETTYRHTGLDEGATWHYRVAAVNTYAAGPRSGIANATTFTRPGTPRNVSAVAGPSGTDVLVTWDATHGGGTTVDHYRVLHGISSGNLKVIATVADATDYLHGAPSLTRPNYYAVDAVNVVGPGPRGAEACGRPAVSPATCELRLIVADAPGVIGPSWTRNTYGFTVEDNLGPGGALPDEDLGRWAEVDEPVEFTIDMGSFANFVDVDGAPSYLLEFFMTANAWKIGDAAPNGPVDVAQVTVNNVVIGTVQAMDASDRGDGAWHMALRSVIEVPAHLVRAGPSNTIVIEALDSTVASAGDIGYGWRIRVDAAMMELVAPPLVILHGWSPDKDWQAPATLESWQATLRDNVIAEAMERFHQDPWAWSGGAPGQPLAVLFHVYDKKQDYRWSTLDLSDAVDAVKARAHYNGRISIVAHSMGGLVARWFIEEGVPTAAGDDTRLPLFLRGESQVRELITIGTPHKGSGLAATNTYNNNANWNWVHYYFDRNGGPLCPKDSGACSASMWKPWWNLATQGAFRIGDRQDVTSDFGLFSQDYNPLLLRLNEKVPDAFWRGPGNVRYFAIAGDGDVQGFGHTDGAVSVDSATLDQRLEYGTITGAAYEDGLDTLHNRMLTFPETAEYVANILFDGTITGGASAGGLGTVAARADQEGSDALVSVTSAAEQSSRPALTVIDPAIGEATVAVDVDHAERAEFHAVVGVADPGLAALVLEAPDGTVIDAAGAAAHGATFLDVIGSGSGTRHLIAMVPAPMDGEWTLRVLKAPASVGSGSVYAWVAFESHVATTVASDAFRHTPGSVARITVRASALDLPISGAAIAGLARDTSTGIEVPLILVDDGTGADAHGGDGIYSVAYEPGTPGLHTFALDMAAVVEGTPVSRQLDGTVWVDAGHVDAPCATNPSFFDGDLVAMIVACAGWPLPRPV